MFRNKITGFDSTIIRLIRIQINLKIKARIDKCVFSEVDMNIKDIFSDSEHKIKAVQKQADAEIKVVQKQAESEIAELHIPVLSESVELFADIGWTSWDSHSLMADGQYKRISKAVKDKMELVSIDWATKSGQVQGTSLYNVSERGCTCQDFEFNSLPCKHMYFLAMQLAENTIQTTLSDVESDINSETVVSCSEMLGCCSLYRECSIAGHCIQTDAYYKQCAYRKNLELGKTFYSKNSSDFNQQKYDYIDAFRRSLNEQERRAFDWAIIYFCQTARGYSSCLCLANPVLCDIVNKFEGFKLLSPIILTRHLFDKELLTIKPVTEIHKVYSKLPAPEMIPYPPTLPKNAPQSEKIERAKIVDEIREKNLKTWMEHYVKDQELLKVISNKFLYFDFSDYHSELEEFYLDNRSLLSMQLPDIVALSPDSANMFKETIEALYK